MLKLQPKTPGLSVEEYPWVTTSLIGVNVLVHLLLFQDRQAIHELGFAPRGAGLHTVLTSMFVHGSWWHLFSNMLFLYWFGPSVERVLGHRKTLILYASAHVFGCLCEFLLDPTSQIPSIGASGAIAGLMGAFGWVFRHERTEVSMRLFTIPLWSSEFSVLFLMLFWAALQTGLWLLFAMVGTVPGIGYGAHVEGFVVGLAFGFVVSRHREEMLAHWRREHAPDIPCAACGGSAKFAIDDLYRCRACGKWIHGPKPATGAWEPALWKRR